MLCLHALCRLCHLSTGVSLTLPCSVLANPVLPSHVVSTMPCNLHMRWAIYSFSGNLKQQQQYNSQPLTVTSDSCNTLSCQQLAVTAVIPGRHAVRCSPGTQIATATQWWLNHQHNWSTPLLHAQLHIFKSTTFMHLNNLQRLCRYPMKYQMHLGTERCISLTEYNPPR
jgi:hypothetical protein